MSDRTRILWVVGILAVVVGAIVFFNEKRRKDYEAFANGYYNDGDNAYNDYEDRPLFDEEIENDDNDSLFGGFNNNKKKKNNGLFFNEEDDNYYNGYNGENDFYNEPNYNKNNKKKKDNSSILDKIF